MATSLISPSTFQEEISINYSLNENPPKKNISVEKVIWVVTKIFIVLAAMAAVFAGTFYLGFSLTVSVIFCAATGLIITGIFLLHILCNKVKDANQQKQLLSIRVDNCRRIIKKQRIKLKNNKMKIKEQRDFLQQIEKEKLLLESNFLSRLTDFEGQRSEILNELEEVEKISSHDIFTPFNKAKKPKKRLSFSASLDDVLLPRPILPLPVPDNGIEACGPEFEESLFLSHPSQPIIPSLSPVV